MTSVQEQVVILRAAKNRRAIWCHGAQSGPAFGLRDIASTGEQVINHMFYSVDRMRPKPIGIARDLGLARNANAVPQPCDRDFMRFIHDR